MRGICLAPGDRISRRRVAALPRWQQSVAGGRITMADIRTVIAVTGEDDRFAPIREAATERALAEHASPVATEWSAEGTEEDVGDRLGPEELEAAGREAIARQVEEARAKGVDAWGWLPSDKSRDALVEYASREPAARVFGPKDDPDLDLGDLPEAELVPAGTRPASG
jgi:hypothetical protein